MRLPSARSIVNGPRTGPGLLQSLPGAAGDVYAFPGTPGANFWIFSAVSSGTWSDRHTLVADLLEVLREGRRLVGPLQAERTGSGCSKHGCRDERLESRQRHAELIESQGSVRAGGREGASGVERAGNPTRRALNPRLHRPVNRVGRVHLDVLHE